MCPLPDMQLLVDQVSRNHPARCLLIKVAKGPVLPAWYSAMPWFVTENTKRAGYVDLKFWGFSFFHLLMFSTILKKLLLWVRKLHAEK